MSHLPCISGRQCAQALERLGFVFKRQKGSHMIYHRDHLRIVIPDHPELGRGTLAAILRQACVDVDEFLKQL